MQCKNFLEWNVLTAFLKMTTTGHLHIAERNKFQVWVQQKQKSDLLNKCGLSPVSTMPVKSVLVTNIFKNMCEEVLQYLSSNCYKCEHSIDIQVCS